MNLFLRLQKLYDFRLQRQGKKRFNYAETMAIQKILDDLAKDLAPLSDALNRCRAAIIIGDRQMYLKNILKIKEYFIAFEQQVVSELNETEKKYPWPKGEGKS